MSTATRNTKLRIDFIVREVCEDGSVPEEELRYVKFGDECSMAYVRDFFDRAGNAMGLMFKPNGAHTLSFVSCGPNKIAVIKVIRELTGLGLKEAKDLAEAPSGTPILIVNDNFDVQHCTVALSGAGARVELRPFRKEDLESRNPTLPALTEFVRKT